MHMIYPMLFCFGSFGHEYILYLLHRPLSSVLSMFKCNLQGIVNEMVLGQVVTFPGTNSNIAVSCEKYNYLFK